MTARDPEKQAPEAAPEALGPMDFATFVLSLGSSAMVHLGRIPAPGGSAPQIDLPAAKQIIDILGMLEEKTRGNLDQSEEKLLKSLEARRVKIQKLVKKAESDLYRRVAISIDGPAKKMWFPIIGKGKAAEAARWALTQQLKPYIWGGAGPHGYDCSGLVMAAYQRVGISLPHYTGDLWRAGTHISRDQLRPGDLVFFYNDLHHVGIYIGGGYMIHAPRTGDVIHIAKIAGRPYAGAVRIAD